MLERPVALLMADDDEDDRMLARDALEEARFGSPFFQVEDGVELLDYLKRRGRYADPASSPRPGVILLDLNMPRMDGRQALKEIKADPALCHIPVIVLTTSKAEEDILRSYQLGAAGYLAKPVTFEGLVEAIRLIGRFYFVLAELPAVEG